MTTAPTATHPAVHDHGVVLDDTFDFLNTSELENGALVDRLQTPAQAIEWFAARGLMHAESATATDRGLERVRVVRTALREIADAVVEGRVPRSKALDVVNGTIRSRAVTELIAGPDGVGIGHRHVGDPIEDALARIADPLIEELAAGHPERVRICANDTCRWVFYDESRAGRRRWCDMATCGNRAKAARHRARRRSVAAGKGSGTPNQPGPSPAA
jgi:predicted RNA-binding Zn ribbon-like protein